jgi:(2R)-sulfolactate sulfo-lyase subunit alpha
MTEEHMSYAAAGAGSATKQAASGERRTIHIVLHEAKDTVGVAVVEGIKAGSQLNAWIMDEDEVVTVAAKQDIPIGHKVALKDMAVGDTVFKYGVDIGKVVAPITAGEHAHVHNIKTKRW